MVWTSQIKDYAFLATGSAAFIGYHLDRAALEDLFQAHRPRKNCHLAAQAGVRNSLTNPFSYQKANLEGFLNLLELAKRLPVERFVYASSSSVYGGLTKMPFSETQWAGAPHFVKWCQEYHGLPVSAAD